VYSNKEKEAIAAADAQKALEAKKVEKTALRRGMDAGAERYAALTRGLKRSKYAARLELAVSALQANAKHLAKEEMDYVKKISVPAITAVSQTITPAIAAASKTITPVISAAASKSLVYLKETGHKLRELEADPHWKEVRRELWYRAVDAMDKYLPTDN